MVAERVKKTFCTTSEAAEMLGVSLRTIQLWVEKGLLEAWKTEGGHRRISRQSVESLLAEPAESRQAQAVAKPAVDFTIMVVEDEATQRMVYEATLRRWPMRPQVVIAGDGYEAMVKLGQVMPDLLIADLRMPGMDGFRMLRAIRASAAYDDMGIAVVTGLEADEIAAQGGLPDDIPVFSKPVPFARLLAIAERLASVPGPDGDSR